METIKLIDHDGFTELCFDLPDSPVNTLAARVLEGEVLGMPRVRHAGGTSDRGALPAEGAFALKGSLSKEIGAVV